MDKATVSTVGHGPSSPPAAATTAPGHSTPCRRQQSRLARLKILKSKSMIRGLKSTIKVLRIKIHEPRSMNRLLKSTSSIYDPRPENPDPRVEINDPSLKNQDPTIYIHDPKRLWVPVYPRTDNPNRSAERSERRRGHRLLVCRANPKALNTTNTQHN